MFIEEPGASFPPSGNPPEFYIGELLILEAEPDPDLMVQIGWKQDQYVFAFYEAGVFRDDFPTSSWIEVAYSAQLGGAFVLWRSGVSALEAPRSISYGWVETVSVSNIAAAIERKAVLHGPFLEGFCFNSLDYYGQCHDRSRSAGSHL